MFGILNFILQQFSWYLLIGLFEKGVEMKEEWGVREE